MKKQGLFLAAGLAAVSAGIMVNGSAFAAHAVVPLESENDIKMAHALADHSNVTLFEFHEAGPTPYSDTPVISIADGEKPESLEFDCSGGNPLEGVTDYSLLNADSMASFLSDVEYIKLCSAENVDWTELAKIEYVDDLVISPVNNEHNLEPEELIALRDETIKKPVVDITGIEKMTNLEALCIIGVPLGSLQTIPQLPDLDMLHLEADAITSIEGIENFEGSTDLNLGYNNIVNFDPWLEAIRNSGYPESEWRDVIGSIVNTFDNNKGIYKVSSSDVELPEYFHAIIEAMIEAEPDYAAESVLVEGMEYNLGDSTAKLDLSKSVHTITIAGFGIDLVVEYDYEEENDNPETLDHSILGWAIGAAAAIMASASLMIRSRR